MINKYGNDNKVNAFNNFLLARVYRPLNSNTATEKKVVPIYKPP